MRFRFARLMILLLGMALPARPGHALQFKQVQVSTNEVMIGGQGPIIRGDAAALQQALAAVPASVKLLGLAFDSPGGSVAEGEELAKIIRARKLLVAIPANTTCASACFLLLAASPQGLVAKNALIGVHGVSESGEDTTVAKATTVDMARAARDFGVPSSIIGQMLQTEPSRVQWLQEADLRSMGVVVYDAPDAVTAAHQLAPAITPPPAPKMAALEAISSPAYQDGLADRRAWDSWIATLHGTYRDGVLFWAGLRDPQQPAPCYGSNGESRGEFTLGCETARQRLAPLAAKRRANGDYAQGWNSTPGPIAPVAAVAPPVAEFQGVMFCQQQPTHLSLKLLPASDLLHRPALLTFGPAPTGSLTMEGRFDLDGGSMDLRPLSSVSQSDSSLLVGLEGHSGDGGKIFTGRVTASRNCTMFTLKRIG